MLNVLEGEAHLAELKVRLADEQIGTIHVFMGDHSIPGTDSDDDGVTYPPITSDISSDDSDSDSHSLNSSPRGSDAIGSLPVTPPTSTPLTSTALKYHEQMVDSETRIVMAA